MLMIQRTIPAVAALLLSVGLLLGFAGDVRAIVVHGGRFQPGVTYDYTYELNDATGVRLPRNGSMQLRFTTDNIISGYYDPNDYLAFIPVTGGRQGNTFWLDIGSSEMRLLHVSGTIAPNGSLHGYAYRGSLTHQYSFNAKLK